MKASLRIFPSLDFNSPENWWPSLGIATCLEIFWQKIAWSDLRRGNNKIVLCETYKYNKKPTHTNHRWKQSLQKHCATWIFRSIFWTFPKGNLATWWWSEPKNIVRGLGSSKNTHCSTLIRSLHATEDQDDRIDSNKDFKDHENFTSASLWLAKEGFPWPPGSLLLRCWSK